ncbi:MAG: hypothetical protein Q8N14_02130, partial [Candidatus Omnitrophota bacterium]|nr:hypothetical protein [Candidatus Omnitrophota bacterium]
IGEKIVYAVKMGPIRMGTATLSYFGKDKLGSKDVEIIEFKTTGLNFLDIEKIYAESKTFYPVRVERTLNIWGRKMDIVEDYDTQDNSWRLTRRENGKISQEVFKENSRAQNIISVVYFYRQLADLKMGESLEFNFSSVEVKLRIAKIVDFPLAGKVYKAYLLESVPAKYRVWLDSSEQRIPLRIDGSLLGFGSMAMIMREHN